MDDQNQNLVVRYPLADPSRQDQPLRRWQAACCVLLGLVVGLLVAELSPRAGAAIVPLPLGAGERAGLLQEYAKTLAERNTTITNLTLRVKTLNASLREKEQAVTVAEAQPSRGPDPELVESLRTEKGLIDETHRITGIEHVAVVDLPTGTRWR